MSDQRMGCSLSQEFRIQNMSTEVIIGDQFIDKSCFLFNALIGEGGFGKVYSAVLASTRNWFAVKEINKHDLLVHKTGVDMLINELYAMQRIEHTFVIRLHFAFQDRKSCYLVLDLKTGGDLRHYLKKRTLFEERDVAFYVACISSALDYIHSKNVIHRDVKPENIILDSHGFPHLTDFGVAHIGGPKSDLNPDPLLCTLASGTKQYLAPEVFSKVHVHGPEVDYWGLGVLAYELLYGRRPFDKHCPTVWIQYLENAYYLMEKKKHKAARARKLDTMRRTSLTGQEEPCLAQTQETIVCANRRVAEKSKCISHSSTQSPASRSTVINKHSPGNSSAIATGGSNATGPYPLDHHSDHGNEALYVTPSNSPISNAHYPTGNSLELPSLVASVGKNVTACQQLFHSNGDMCCEGGVGYSGSTVMCTPNSSPSKPISGTSSPNGHWLPHPPNAGSGLRSCSGSPAGSGSISSTHHRANRAQQMSPPGTGGRVNHLQVIVDDAQSDDDRNLSTTSPKVDVAGEDCSPDQFFGGYWAVAHGELPEHLRIVIPRSNVWLGQISADCVDFLEGLFEIRPGLRLGCSNIEALRQHPFLEFYGMSNWADLQVRRVCPTMTPGRRASILAQEIDPSSDYHALLHGVREAGLTEKEEYSPQFVSNQDQKRFAGFFYVSRPFQEYWLSTFGQSGVGLPEGTSSLFAGSPALLSSEGGSKQLISTGDSSPSSSRSSASGKDGSSPKADSSTSSIQSLGFSCCVPGSAKVDISSLEPSDRTLKIKNRIPTPSPVLARPPPINDTEELVPVTNRTVVAGPTISRSRTQKLTMSVNLKPIFDDEEEAPTPLLGVINMKQCPPVSFVQAKKADVSGRPPIRRLPRITST